MPSSPVEKGLDSLPQDLLTLTERLGQLKHHKWIQRALAVLVRLTEEEVDRLDWKILTASLEDLEQAFQTFYPYRHIRKIAIFGSARTVPEDLEYLLAADFARRITQQGFMAITGAGGGIMEAANQGAGRQNSFGLNIQLPFEQGSNRFIEGDSKLIQFKYFFTRKLFFLRESDAIAIFPGGFGTLDEAFEAITLCQTGKYGPVPIVLIDAPDAGYWQAWNDYICNHLVNRGLVSAEDHSLYTITHDLEVACQTICDFYRTYHSSRYVGRQFVLRLHCELTETAVEQLNEEFGDIVVQGKIEKCEAFPEEAKDPTVALPRLAFEFNQRDFARLMQMIRRVNELETISNPQDRPEWK